MVWTDELLDYAASEAPDIHPMLHLMAYRGTRRGETCGLLDAEVRLAKAETGVINQIVTYGGGRIQHKRPQSQAGNRDVVLDTVAVLTTYKAGVPHGSWRPAPRGPTPDCSFVRPDGEAWHPASMSQRFRQLARRGGFPPVRLHDLRHGAATIALEAGVDVKVVAEQLGHSSTTLTRDTCQSVSKSLHHEAAAAVAQRIKVKRRTAA